VSAIELGGVFGEIDAAAGGCGELLQGFICFAKALVDEIPVGAVLRGPFFALERFAEIARERNGENAHVGSLQFLLDDLPGFRRRRVEAGGQQDNGFLSGKGREPVERGGYAGGEVEVGEANVEIEILKGIARGSLAGRETENELGSVGVRGDGHAISGRDAVEERVGSAKVALAEEIDAGTGFDEEQKLRGLFDGEKVGDGLLDLVVEDMEVFAAEAGDEMTGGVGDGDADVDAIDGDADGRGGLLRLGGRQRG